jgi:hypothetical protein
MAFRSVPLLPNILAGVVVCAVVSPANAAVRSCKPGITSDIVRADTDLLGKRRALQSWTIKAAKLGLDYTSWRLADRKVLGCKPAVGKSSAFECIAYAVPCTTTQTPPRPSDKRRVRPRSRSAPIET